VIYPLLLLASTTLAAAFCYLYISKPVIIPPSPPPAPAVVAVAPPSAAAPQPIAGNPAAAAAQPDALLPNAGHLPGDPPTLAQPGRPTHTSPRRAIPGDTTASAFEETNLRIQHVLTAQTPGGDLSRIVLDVPVIYQTGALAWTQNEVAEARLLLASLADYQEQTRTLRDEGVRLLSAWNRLVERAAPTPVLRADSPALPGNQQAGDEQPQPTGLDTSESIQLQPPTQ
jgi:hypothetical protein